MNTDRTDGRSAPSSGKCRQPARLDARSLAVWVGGGGGEYIRQTGNEVGGVDRPRTEADVADCYRVPYWHGSLYTGHQLDRVLNPHRTDDLLDDRYAAQPALPSEDRVMYCTPSVRRPSSVLLRGS